MALGAIASDDMAAAHGDFDIWYHSAKALIEGESPYRESGRAVNLNPPFWTLLVSPLVVLEPLNAYRVFTVVSATTAVGYMGVGGR